MSQLMIESAKTNSTGSGGVRYSAGTLVYTKAGLVAPFACRWLDFQPLHQINKKK